MPGRNLVVQFIGGAVALASGQSVGREAPSVHLGAGVASLLGQRIGLPNNSIRILVVCGAAAAIAASFDMPLAGVVFAMEVIMVEYTIAGFVPVILSAVAATAITRAVFGEETAFLVPLLGLASLWELGFIILMGGLIGVISALFVGAIRALGRTVVRVHVMLQLTATGCFVGALGVAVPEALGLGYDTANTTIAGHLGVLSIITVFVAKFAASGLCAAVRMPGGLIGPSVLMGCLLGACFAKLIVIVPGVAVHPALYAMLGMGAMMGAVLQAPLAALLALLEMTGKPLIIMPGMLAVVSANLTAKIVFKQESVFTHLIRDAGLDYRQDPLSQSLRRIGVAAVMNRSFEHSPRHLNVEQVRELLTRGPQWIIVESEVERPLLLQASDLARYVESQLDEDVDLVAIPADRYELAPIHLQANLFEARELLLSEDADVLYVRRPSAPMSFRTFGVLRREEVESAYESRR